MTEATSDLAYDERGDGRRLLALHPGGVDARALRPLVDALGDGYRVLTPDQRGHGRTADTDEPFSFASMARDTAALLDKVGATSVDVLGYSDGAILALYLARARPDLVRSVVFACAAAHHEGWVPGVLDAEPPAFMGDGYGEVSPDGRDHWPIVVAKSKEMHRVEPDLTRDDLAALTMPVLVVQGDDDEIDLVHTVEVYTSLPDGELAIVPRTTHALMVEKPDLLARLIRDFHSGERSPGLVPIRRA